MPTIVLLYSWYLVLMDFGLVYLVQIGYINEKSILHHSLIGCSNGFRIFFFFFNVAMFDQISFVNFLKQVVSSCKVPYRPTQPK